MVKKKQHKAHQDPRSLERSLYSLSSQTPQKELSYPEIGASKTMHVGVQCIQSRMEQKAGERARSRARIPSSHQLSASSEGGVLWLSGDYEGSEDKPGYQ